MLQNSKLRTSAAKAALSLHAYGTAALRKALRIKSRALTKTASASRIPETVPLRQSLYDRDLAAAPLRNQTRLGESRGRGKPRPYEINKSEKQIPRRMLVASSSE